jgi:hypothetical protein
MIPYLEEVRMESLTEKEINIAQAHKEVTGYVAGEMITFFQNNKVRCPIL